MSDVSGIQKLNTRTEEAMNCRTCNTTINYNYITNCPQCGGAIEGGELPKIDPSLMPVMNRAWLYSLANIVYVLVTSAMGMISGAVVMYFSAAVIYIAVATTERYPGQHCSEGMAIGMLSILCGGFLGTTGAAAFAVKHPIQQSRRETNIA